MGTATKKKKNELPRNTDGESLMGSGTSEDDERGGIVLPKQCFSLLSCDSVQMLDEDVMEITMDPSILTGV